jgi:hypothetical protein
LLIRRAIFPNAGHKTGSLSRATRDGHRYDQQRQDVARSSPGPPSGDGEEIDTPPRCGHRALKVSHVAPRAARVARAGPRASSEMLADDIEQCLAIGGLQANIGCRVGTAGVQAPNQFRVFSTTIRKANLDGGMRRCASSNQQQASGAGRRTAGV